jgi:hypothetical protein
MQPDTTQQVPELGRLKAIAERLATCNTNIENFQARFYGPGPTAADQIKTDASLTPYLNDLNSVFDQVARLENLVNGLTSIG